MSRQVALWLMTGIALVLTFGILLVGHAAVPVGVPVLLALAWYLRRELGRKQAARRAASAHPPAGETPGEIAVIDVQPSAGDRALRRIVVGAVAVLGVAFVAVVALILLIAYPPAANPNAPHATLPEVWLGDSARVADVGIGALIATAFVGVTVFGTRIQGRAAALPWLVGCAAGGVAGLGLVLSGLVAELSVPVASPSGGGSPLFPLLTFGAPLVAGLLVGKLTGRVEAGLLGGFWCGLALGLVNAVGTPGNDLLLANRLTQTVWLSHLDCPGLAGSALAGCEIRDDLGGAAMLMLVLPLIGAGSGVLGGLFGSVLATVRMPEGSTSRALLAPAVFAGGMFAMIVAEVSLRLW
jgi:hypothetical protein